MSHGNGRAWVAECKWAGAQKAFWFGTVLVRLGAPMHEVENAVFAELSTILPSDIRKPEITKLVPGQLIFVPELEQDQ